MTSKFVNNSGWLSQYALACGYIETNDDWKEKRVACLWKEGGCFHVQAYSADGIRDYWKSFPTYTDAKKNYIFQLKYRNAKRTINKG